MINCLNLRLSSLNVKIRLNASYHSGYHYYCSAIYTYLGHCYAKQNKDAQADDMYKKAKFQDHENYCDKTNFLDYIDNIDFQSAGYDALRNKAYKKAIEIFSQDSEDGKTCLGLGIAYFHKKDYDKAIDKLLKAEHIATKEHSAYHISSSALYFERAYLYFLQKNYDLCVTDLCKSLDLCENNIDALLLRAQIYALRESPLTAAQDYDAVLKISPNNKHALAGLKAIYNGIPG